MTPMHLMTQSCDIKRITWTKSARGEPVASAPATVFGSVPCAVQAAKGIEAFEFEKRTGRRLSRFFVPYTSPSSGTGGGSTITVQADDEIVVGSRTFRATGPAFDETGLTGFLVFDAYEETA